MLRIILFLCLSVALSGQTRDELRAHIVKEEGYRHSTYWLNGQAHIGIGHRLNHWVTPWSDRQIERVFTSDLKAACDAAYSGISNFSSHPKPIRIMLVGIAFTVGAEGFKRFYRFRAAIERFDYKGAARELEDSAWYHQLPNRADRYINLLNSI